MKENKLTIKHIKILGWISIVFSIIGIVTFLEFLYTYKQFTNPGLWLIFLFSCFGIYAGKETIKNNLKGKKLSIYFYAIQIISIKTPTLFFSINTAVTFGFHFGDQDSAIISINIIALVLMAFSIRMVREHSMLVKYEETA